IVTSQAVPVPTASVRTPVPNASQTVAMNDAGRTVATKWGQTLSAGLKARRATAAIGTAMIASTTATPSVQAGDALRRARQPPTSFEAPARRPADALRLLSRGPAAGGIAVISSSRLRS